MFSISDVNDDRLRDEPTEICDGCAVPRGGDKGRRSKSETACVRADVSYGIPNGRNAQWFFFLSSWASLRTCIPTYPLR